MNIGERIKFFRKKKNMTQAQLAEKIGMAEISIRKIEASPNVPRDPTLRKIANAFDIPPLLLTDFAEDLTEEELASFLEKKDVNFKFVPIAEPGDEQILGPYKSLNDKGKKKVEEYARDLVNNYEYNINGIAPNYEHHLKMQAKKSKK